MSELNIYKPRYRIPFLAKNKVWPYKNSRLRRFFNIRGRKLVRGGLFKRYVMVFNNMKWSIARRYIRPYMNRRRAIRRRYKNIFYVKQQLKIFYGKQKEHRFSRFFKQHLNNLARRNLSFSASLERRADIVLFRLRFLPTIYACQQYIHHYGLLINDKKEQSPYALVVPGDIISFEEPIWSLFFNYLWERVYWRAYGIYLWKSRQYKVLKKKLFYLRKDKRNKVHNVLLLKKLFKIVSGTKSTIIQIVEYSDSLKKLLLQTTFQNETESLKANTFYVEHKRINLRFKSQLKAFLNKFKVLYSKKWRFRKWKWTAYYKYFYQTLSLIVMYYKNLKKTKLEFAFLEYSYYKWFVEKDFLIKINQKEGNILVLNHKYSEGTSAAQKIKIKNDLKKLLDEKESLSKQKVNKLLQVAKHEELLANEYVVWTEKLTFLINLILRRRIKALSLKPRYGLHRKTNKVILYKSRIKKYMALQRKRTKRGMSIPRIKPVHWYVPSYIHFDATTLSAVYLYNPSPNEVIYSFKCSLKNVYSFYRSRGF